MCHIEKKPIACRDVPVMWKSAVQAAWLCLHFNRQDAVAVLAQIIMCMGRLGKDE